MIEDRPASVNNYIERIPQHILDFKAMNLHSQALWNSGVMTEFYDGHFMMLESFFTDSDNDYLGMYESIDHILYQLTGYDEQLLIVSEHLFKLFEKRSLFKAAEHLSLRMLEQNSCTIEGELQRRFEQYRTMKKGKKAPDIKFTLAPTDTITRKTGFKNGENALSEIKSKYKLVVFWASWCQHCQMEIPLLYNMYHYLQEKEIEVISISLDMSQLAFDQATSRYKWYSFCDFKKWESPAVHDYFVFNTPSFFLLDENNTILLKPSSTTQIKSYVDYALK